MIEALTYKVKGPSTSTPNGYKEFSEIYIPSEKIAFNYNGYTTTCDGPRNITIDTHTFKETLVPTTKIRVEKSLVEDLKSYIVLKSIFDKKTEAIKETIQSCFSRDGEILLDK
jgi:hypothetical protein